MVHMSEKCAVYARVSTDKQEDSVIHQVSLLREYIKVKNLGELPDEFIYEDIAISATKTVIWSRPAMKRLLSDAGDGKFNTIVFKGISRLARNTHEALGVLEKLKANGLRVISYEENYDSSQENSNFMFTMHAAVAEYEAEKMAIRIRLGMREEAKKGRYFGATPFGYEKKNGMLVINEDEAKIVEEIFRLYLTENLGTYTIAKKLNDKGIKKSGKLWHPKTILGILRNPIYTGDVVYNKTRNASVNDKEDWITCEGAHEPIIKKEDFQKANILLSKRGNKDDKTTSSTAQYPLTGILKCGHCGSSMLCYKRKVKVKGVKEYNYRHYGCHKRHCLGRNYCDQELLDAENIEEAIIDKLKEILTKLKQRIQAGEGPEIINGGSGELKKQLKKIELKIEKTNKDTVDIYFQREEMTETQYKYLVNSLKDKMNRLTIERDELQMQIELAEQEQEQLVEINQNIDDFFTVDKSEIRKMRRLVSYFIEKIIVTDTNLDIHYKVKLD